MKRIVLFVLIVLLMPLPAFSEDTGYGIIEPGAAALLGAGMLFMESSSLLIRPMLLVAQDGALASYQAYLSDTSGSFDSENFDDGALAEKLQIQHWVNFGGGMLFTSSLFFFPDEQVTISIPGKISLIAGLAAIMTGNFFDFLALGSYAESKYYGLGYEDATAGAADLYAAYADSYGAFTAANGMGLILKGVGGAAVFASFLLPGKKQPYFPSTLHKIMNAGALLFMTAGMVTKSMAQVHLVQIPYAWDDYNDSLTKPAALYEEYQKLNTAYNALMLTSYGLWIAGGSALITALFLPSPPPSTAKTAEKRSALQEYSVTVLPAYRGNLGLGLTVSK